MVQGQSIRPAQGTILELISLVRKQASAHEIKDLLKRDPTLSFNLFRFINSAGFGVRSFVAGGHVRQPNEAALAKLALPHAATQALLQHAGPLAPFLELTIGCETGDDAAFGRTANLLGLSNSRVNWTHVQALVWTDEMGG